MYETIKLNSIQLISIEVQIWRALWLFENISKDHMIIHHHWFGTWDLVVTLRDRQNNFVSNMQT